jgi:hypothetical protein
VLAGTAEFMKFWAEAHVDKVHAAIKKGANLVVMGVVKRVFVKGCQAFCQT